MVNKKGWIRIVEAFVAILLIAGILLILAGEDFTDKEDSSQKIYDIQLAILRDIQVEDSLRNDILAVMEAQVKTDDITFPPAVQSKINSKTPSYLECKTHICELKANCIATGLPEESIYVQSVVISATATQYNPKQLKLFCWVK